MIVISNNFSHCGYEMVPSLYNYLAAPFLKPIILIPSLKSLMIQL